MPFRDLAVEHLLERGFRHFGCVGIRGINWSQQRRDAFVSSLAEADCNCAVYHVPAHSRTFTDWEENLDRLAEWVKQLPKPAGVLVCDDLTGQKVLDSCRGSAFPCRKPWPCSAPTTTKPVCAVCDPPLSSVDPDHSRVGYEAARLLDSMIARRRSPLGSRFFSNRLGVVTRQSTDMLAIEDPDVAMAVGFIQGHAFADLRVDDVVEHVLLSAAPCSDGFATAWAAPSTEKSSACEMKRACELLAETDMPIGLVAKKAGFRHQAYMGAVFQEKLGKTPGQYRKQAKI